MAARKNVWRFIDSGAQDGATNMATDEALARFSSAEAPTLRLYRWRPYAISIGYHQKAEDVDFEKCQNAGIDVVRRPTGGRAILHAHEVTYCVVIPRGSVWFTANAIETYNQISQALATGLERLNLPVALQRVRSDRNALRNYRDRFACFSTSARYEIHAHGKKLVGSAQRRFDRALLQHGSILLGPQHLSLYEFLASRGNGEWRQNAEQLRAHTVCIEQLLQRPVHYEEVVQAIKHGFEEHFGIVLQPDVPDPKEIRGTNQLKPKYTTC